MTDKQNESDRAIAHEIVEAVRALNAALKRAHESPTHFKINFTIQADHTFDPDIDLAIGAKKFGVSILREVATE